MAICKNKYKNLGSEDDKLLFKTCTCSIEYFYTYFKELKNHLLRYNKYEELYNYCYNNLTNIKNTPISRITTLKLINITLILNPKNINYLINKKIVTYAYKLLKRDKEGVNKKFNSYFGPSTNEERNLIVTESKYLFRAIKNITLTKNSKEEKYIKRVMRKIENKKINIPNHLEISQNMLLQDFDNYKKEVYELLENDNTNSCKIDYVYSKYIKLLDAIKKKTREFLDNGEYKLYCDFIKEIQDEDEIRIRYESYLLCFPNQINEKEEIKEKKQDSLLTEEEMNKNLKNESAMNTVFFADINTKNRSNSNMKNERLFSSSLSNLIKDNTNDKNEFNSLPQSFSNNFTEFEINSYNKNAYYTNSVDNRNENYEESFKEEEIWDKGNVQIMHQGVTNNDVLENEEEGQVQIEEKKIEQKINLTPGKKNKQEINLIDEEEKEKEVSIIKEEEKQKVNVTEEEKEIEINLEEQKGIIYNENKIEINEITKNNTEGADINKDTTKKIISNRSVQYNEVYNILENNYYKVQEKKKNISNENKIILDFINEICDYDKNTNKSYQSDNKNFYDKNKCIRKGRKKEVYSNDSFDTIENEIINEFNSFINEEKKEYNSVNANKNIEFKNTINRGNSLIWNNLIKKSNFYGIKEDFLNYNKFLKEKEKETKIKTLGDLLGINNYINLKKNNIKYTRKRMNPEYLNNLIKKYTKCINVNTTLRDHKEYEIKSNDKNVDIKMEGNKEEKIQKDEIIKGLKREDIYTSSFNKYFTIYDNIKNVQKSILKDNSILYSDDNIEIHLEQYYFGIKGLIKLYLKNKKLVNCYDVDLQISNAMLFPLKFKFLNYEKMLSYNATSCYEIAVKCLHIYKGFPLIKISYRMQDMLKKSIDLRLPISINKFMKKMKITKDVFNKFWDDEKFNLYKKEKIILKRDVVDKEFIFKNSCLGYALSLCYIEDKIYFCGCYSENSEMENYFVLVAVEEVKKKKLRITCKSNNPILSSAILFLIILIHKNYETK